MRFDVIIGNPPYQLSDGGGAGSSATPIYHRFVDQARQLQPSCLLMIIPARWYSGGKGLGQFRAHMLADKRMKVLVDFEHSAEVFPDVDVAGGICYFLWEKDYNGLCKVINASQGVYHISLRALDEFSVFVRNARAISIIHKVANASTGLLALSQRISRRQPFGIASTYIPTHTGIPCWFTQRMGLLHVNAQDISDPDGLLHKWKLLIAFAPIAGQTDFSKPIRFYSTESTRIARPGECCSETWLVACAFDTEQEVINFKRYLFTKTVRFLLLQHVISQNITRRNFSFIPDLGKYQTIYTDELLVDMWSLTADEWAYIDSKILATA
ncbi:site-specific DNA-methyltransferase (adenine-specific) [Methylophilus rhizosphaerae]|uniref:Site-specific DNA-methyltransferase (Adenine-specific) n=1 Tax=Methylophilus rhizosphaerae TaxID=492660 RepID=A0A1G9E2B2_9PROT|nr:Eco57I restriction-modification methylase domain-containing protein [Methylophilus rhizosphaerae]SDK70285.1 site-specific DNA-methyltransferase (adenine-specific) [Methylophilus rhizosphaerae]